MSATGVLGYRFALDTGAVPGELRSLTALFGLAGVGGLSMAIKESTEEAGRFEHALARVSTLLPANQSALDRYGKSVDELAVKFGTNTDIVADALFQTISASVDAADAVDFLNDVAGKAAIGGFTDMQTSVDGITNVLNAYGLSASNSALDVADAFFVANIKGKTTFEELARTVGNVGPTAEKAGLSFEEMFSAIATGTKVGLRTSTVVDSLRTALSATFKPSEQAVKLADELGLQFDEGSIKAMGFAGFLEEVRTKTGGSAEALSTLFGSVEAANVIMTLTTEQGLASFNDAMADMGSEVSATETAYNKAANTFESKSNRIKEALKKGFRGAGQVFMDSFARDMDEFQTKVESIEATIQRVAKAMVDGIRFAADNIWQIVSVMLLGKVGGALTKLSKHGGIFGSFAPGRDEKGRFTPSASRVMLDRVTLVAQTAVIGAVAARAIGRALAQQANETEGAEARSGFSDTALAARLALSGLFSSDSFAYGPGGGGLQDFVNRLRSGQGGARDVSTMSPEDLARAMAAASELTGIEITSADRLQKVQDAIVDAIRNGAIRGEGGVLVGAREQLGTYSSLGAFGTGLARTLDKLDRMVGFESSDAPNVVRGQTFAPSVTRAISGVGDRFRAEEVEARRRNEALSDVVKRRGSLAGIEHLLKSNFEGAFAQRDARSALGEFLGENNGGDVIRREFAAASAEIESGVLEAFDFVGDMFQPVVDGMQSAADKMGAGVVVEILHKIFDQKPRRPHGVSLQKRGAAKGPTPRYHALVLRHGYGAPIVEPLPENVVNVGMNRGAF